MADVPNRVAKVRFFEGPDSKELSLYLDISGQKFAVMQFSSSFAKNEIPTGTCVLGTGTSVRENGNDQDAQKLIEELDGAELTKAKVYLKFGPLSQLDPTDIAGALGKTGPQCIFEGYFAGLSYRRSGSQIQITVNLVHRLVDLTFGSLMTGWLHASNPINHLTPAVNIPLGGCDASDPAAGGAAKRPAWTPGVFFKKSIEDNPELFGKQVLGVLECMTTLDVFQPRCDSEGFPRRPNKAAGEVIKEMESKTGGLRAPMSSNPFPAAIGAYFKTLIDSTTGTTYWDLLVGKICPDFVMAVIPLPSLESSPDKKYAYLTPDTPGLSKEYKTLYLDDYSGFNFNARLWKPLYGVIVYADGSDVSGHAVGFNKITKAICTGGRFPSPDDLGDQLGQLLITSPPDWMQEIAKLLQSYKDTGNRDEAVHDAIEADSNLDAPAQEPADLAEDRNSILDKYAQLLYVQNAINGRSGSFTSKLRFDISPGTVLKLDKSSSRGGSATKQLPTNLYAQVSRVSHNINAELPIAKTTFECVHVRTEKENNEGKPKGKYSIEEHPFLDGEFKGAPLIEEWST